jgi:hypothetical protein
MWSHNEWGTAHYWSVVEARPVSALDSIASTRGTDLTLGIKAFATALTLVGRQPWRASEWEMLSQCGGNIHDNIPNYTCYIQDIIKSYGKIQS